MAATTHTSVSRTALLLFCASLLAPLIAAQSLTVSGDGFCGADSSQTCLGSRYGDCCSGKGFCGSDVAYCGADCQSAYGTCTSANSTQISSNGDCGASDPEKQICTGSTFGESCSKNGFCGDGPTYAGEGCQPDYGVCDDSSASTASSSTSTSASSSASSSNAAATTDTDTALSAAASTTGSSSTSSSSSASSATSSSSSSSEPSSSPAPALSTGAKAGVAIAAVGCAGLIGAAIFMFLRRRRHGQQRDRRAADAADGDGEPGSSSPSAGHGSPVSSPTTTMSIATTVNTAAGDGAYGKGEVKDQLVELPSERDGRPELRTEPATPVGGFGPVEKDAGTLGVVSELPGESWSGQTKR